MRRRLLLGLLVVIAGAAAVLAIRRWLPTEILRVNSDPYRAAFSTEDGWSVGEDANARADVVDGRYEITVRAPVNLYLSTSDQIFADGVYEVTATQIDGPLDNGYGLVLRADTEQSSFILFEVSGDGFVWVGRCDGQCDSAGWRESSLVNQGVGAPNQLQVVAEGRRLTFFLNGEALHTMEDAEPARGEVGVMVETFGQPGVRVAFEELSVTPLDAE